VRAGEEQPALMLATVDTVRTVVPRREAEPVGVHIPHHVVHLNEEEVFPADRDDDTWVLDKGASNHMTGAVRCSRHWTHLWEVQSILVMDHWSRSRAWDRCCSRLGTRVTRYSHLSISYPS
jgi:hypothetical protein